MQTGCRRCAPCSGMCLCTTCPSQMSLYNMRTFAPSKRAPFFFKSFWKTFTDVSADGHGGVSPGSHDTMTYCLDKKLPIAQSQSWLLQLLGKVLPCITRPIMLKWSTTQVLGVTEQLDAGVRYLDLRVAHVPEGLEKNLHFVHMVYSTALVEDTLKEISEWLESHPQEVVILACRDFNGLTDNLHEYLVACINNIFGDMMCPRGEVPTLNQLWTRGQQVILSYEEASVVSRHRELWPGIPYWWGDQVKPQELIHYLEHMKRCGRPASPGQKPSQVLPSDLPAVPVEWGQLLVTRSPNILRFLHLPGSDLYSPGEAAGSSVSRYLANVSKGLDGSVFHKVNLSSLELSGHM
ncbi:PI-PLC X domain-containing protein 1-like isoform X2 [Prionailurus viverrinus]|uniref:PI-PLC X domain-containing protein 1-like isoform X2 n=1 Tax=Prionailurus viverrinus TaxID=61388 RepID=UPI001FF4BC2C|nr:PI-PLC X domain-containing protein 1-like isoform X2 [Prionailurus viverrinus]